MSNREYKAERRKAILLVLLCIVLCCFATKMVLNHIARSRMLQAVGLDESAGLTQIDYAYWCDPLKYTDGYEIIAFAVNEETWTTPDGWFRNAELTSVDDIADELVISVNTDAILNLSLGGENCGTWYFVDNRADRPFDEQDFYFAYCDDTFSNSVVLFIYRGHHLWGL